MQCSYTVDRMYMLISAEGAWATSSSCGASKVQLRGDESSHQPPTPTPVISEFINLQLQSGAHPVCPTSTRHRVLMASVDLSPRPQGIDRRSLDKI